MARVLMVVANGGSGGMQAQMSMQAQLLATRGHEVHIAVGGEYGSSTGPITTHDLPAFSPRSIVFVRALSALVRRLQPDVVHAHGLRLAPALVMAGIGTTKVLECHGIDPRVTPAAPWKLLRAATRAGVRMAACGTGPATFLATELGEIHLINNLLPDAPTPRDPRLDLDIAADATVAIWPARFSEQKGHSRLIELVAALDDPRLVVLCVGDGPLRDEVEAEVSRRGLSTRIICGDFSPTAGQWLAASDLFIMPSWWEGQPTVGLEALRAGLPLLSLNLLGDEDVVAPGTGVRASRTTDAVDILRRWLNDPSSRPDDQHARDLLLAPHDPDRVARDLASAYGRGL